MKYSIDKKYIAVLVLKALAAYGVGLLIVFLIGGRRQDPEGFIMASLAAAIFVFFFRLLPKPILVEDGTVSFFKKNTRERINIPMSQIVSVETQSGYYHTLTIKTIAGDAYELHPANPEELKDHIF